MSNSPSLSKRGVMVLVFSIFLAGLCSIIYELLISTASSYFLGDSVKQFSITIGVYMASMGLGALVSRNINGDLLSKFILIEIILAFIGGISIPLLYYIYAYTEVYYAGMIFLIVLVGVFTGLEVPLLTRIMDGYFELKVNISNVFSFDYLGALFATLAFPFLILPSLGTFSGSVATGLLNMAIGFINLFYFSKTRPIKNRKGLINLSILVTIVLLVVLFLAKDLMASWENDIYDDRVVYSKQTKYQKIVVTKERDDVRLYLNGNLQFSSQDEHRYHEALVHIPFDKAKQHKEVLMLGGGDGLAAREMLKYEQLDSITIVDIDPGIIDLANNSSLMIALNKESLKNPKVKVLNVDAFKFLTRSKEKYDVVIVDLPDPNNTSLARLYSREFYSNIRKVVQEGGVVCIQSTSAYFSPEAYWCISRTVDKAGFNHVYPYHVYLPSFGDWGFVMASQTPLNTQDFSFEVPTRFLTEEISSSFFEFPKDILPQEEGVSTLDKPIILEFYLDSWKKMY